MAAQFLTTSKLNNIVNMITLGRQSGILRVIRGQGPTREVGQIKFVEGQPVSALLGQLTGPNALSVLSNWGECVYSFEEVLLTEMGDSSFAPDSGGRSPADGAFTSSPPIGPSSGSWPSYGLPPSTTYSQPAAPSPVPGGVGRSGPLPGFPPSTPSQSGELPRPTSPYGMSSTQSLPLSNTPLNPSVMATTPLRTILAEHVEQLPLDRRERMVLLLVDGRRNLTDLARLTRRTEREILAVLEHLSVLGLVQMNR